MIQKVVAKYELNDPDAARRDLEYWLSRVSSTREKNEAAWLPPRVA